MIAGLGAWTMWAPPILLTSWAAMYLWDFFEYATAFEYDGPKGKVRVRAQSYAIDVTGRRAMATGLEVRSATNTRVVSVAHAVIEQDKNTVTRVHAHDVEAVLERKPNGDFTFNDIMPKAPDTKGPEAAVQVEADNVVLKYIDRTRGIVTLNGRADRMIANGFGSGWLVNGTVSFERVGAILLQVLIGPDNLYEVDQ